MKEEEEIKEEEAAEVIKPQHALTPFELEGLWNLLGKLEELPAHKKCVPAGIRNAAALLEDMRVGGAKLFYSGRSPHSEHTTFKQIPFFLGWFIFFCLLLISPPPLTFRLF